MQPSQDALKTLSECFLQTLAPEPEPRKRAEAYLKTASNQAGYGVTLLTLVDAPGLDEQVRQAAAVNFKNFIKYHWDVAEKDAATFVQVQDEEKGKVKAHIVDLMLRCPPKIGAQISEALSVISTHDFPAKWEALLPQLASKLASATAAASAAVPTAAAAGAAPAHPTAPPPSASDLTALQGVLQTANSIFKRFRHAFKSEGLYRELKYCLDGFVQPLLDFTLVGGRLLDLYGGGVAAGGAGGGAPAGGVMEEAALRSLLQCLRLCARIFFSLNSQELPEVFEDHLTEWMQEFHKYLVYDNPALVEKDLEKEGLLEQLKAAVCENINLYMEKNEEEFQTFLSTFVSDVWNLLMALSLTPAGLSPGRDPLAIVALRFLTTVSRSVHHALFSDAEALKKICESVVVPNVRLRDEDEELFDMNYVEYIRRDMEGSDSDTRRRMACELVKGLMVNYEGQVTQLFSQYVAAELAHFAADPNNNWRSKDAAIFLVVALTVRQKTAAAGATATNQLVNLGDFFSSQILPELQAADVDERPVLKADALKFLTTFRSQVPKAACMELMLHIVRFIGQSESNVVHSYAANAVERLLVLKDTDVATGASALRFSDAEVAGLAQPLLVALFAALKRPDSQENPYIMKCIMRVLSRTSIAPEVSAHCLTALAEILMAVCKNPTNLSFNHYLFEAVAALVRHGETDTAADPAARATQAAGFEAALFPVMQAVLELDVQEFAPYVFQILAMLVEMRSAPLPPAYMAVFPALITPLLWERAANVPALVRLLQAYLQKSAKEIVSAGQLAPVLGVFQKLIASKHTDHHGFFILNTVVENLDMPTLAPFIQTIWTLLFYRLQNSRTPKFVRSLLVFMSLFVAKHGAANMAQSIDGVQAGLFLQITGSVWAPNLPTISGKVETKLCAVAAAEVLCQCPALQEEAAAPVWGKLLDAAISLLSRPEEERTAGEDEEGDVPEADELQSGYATVYAQLHHAGKTEEDPVKDKTNDARQYLTVLLSQLCARSPGRFPGIMAQSLSEGSKAALSQMCSTYGVSLV